MSVLHLYHDGHPLDVVPVQNRLLDTVTSWSKEWRVSFQVGPRWSLVC